MQKSKSNQTHPYTIGKPYFIETVTMYFLGTLIAVYEQELVLEGACWVADTGRFHQAMTTGSLDEVEPFGTGQLSVGRGALICAFPWAYSIPTIQK